MKKVWNWIVDKTFSIYWSIESRYWRMKFTLSKWIRKIKRFAKSRPPPVQTVVSIGAGKDFETLSEMSAWLKKRDLIGNNENVTVAIHSSAAVNGVESRCPYLAGMNHVGED